ncbi:LOG family protein [Carboxylicivirga linearis]|uniref:Cytokinin riboside 5'-monophosphate phosphoribohydrolase n=1 Tax=Carboxylicivirga linearis TaxID=1628157 RepID=A0ABS5JV87_9BACT|nr:TIGR00730 family Rossman fold protein [Carboxylicivirga linearis]MBS2098822.1 TIGR00730 family Rossman fold protein [Carboxylicivirga linearis]
MGDICVFCASSAKVDQSYLEEAYLLGEVLVENGYGLKYGGGAVGSMGAVANKVLELNGRVTGVIPYFMVQVEWEHKGVENMIHVETMAERKELLIKDIEAIVVLPGGTGTLEELFEVLSLKKLGQFTQPVILVNTNGYFNALNDFLNKMIDEKFMRPEHGELWHIVDSVKEIPEALKNIPDWDEDALKFAAV